DPAAKGRDVVRGGIGLFNGRYLLVPTAVELQQNGITGRISRTRVNGLFLGLPRPPFILDPNDPTHTRGLLKPDISLLAPELDTPESTQASLGWTHSLATGLYLDAEAVYAKGRKEIVIRDLNFGGNGNPVRPNPTYNQINTFTNDGRSEYKAFILQVNGNLPG